MTSMPYSHIADYPADILARAMKIRLACFDVDGTLTDGRLSFDSEGREMKAFHVLDGQGLALLQRVGITVVFVTARTSRIVDRRAAELGVEVHQGIKDKAACVRDIIARAGIAVEQLAYMGDDLGDLAPMATAGLSVAPFNAHAWVRERVHWRTTSRGGEGAARELCDLLLAAQGHAETLLAEATSQ